MAEDHDRVRAGYPSELIASALDQAASLTGRVSSRSAAVPGSSSSAVDPCARMIAVARRRLRSPDGVTFHVGRFEDMMVTEASFDAAFYGRLPSRRGRLRRLRRMGDAGGRRALHNGEARASRRGTGAAAAERGDDSAPAEHQSWYEFARLDGRFSGSMAVASRAAPPLGPAEEVNDQHDEQNDHQDPDDAVTHVASSFGSRGHTPCCPT